MFLAYNLQSLCTTTEFVQHRSSPNKKRLRLSDVKKPDLRNGPCEEDGSYFLDRDGLQFLFIMTLVAAELIERQSLCITHSASQPGWLNFKLFGIKCLVGNMSSLKTFISGSRTAE